MLPHAAMRHTRSSRISSSHSSRVPNAAVGGSPPFTAKHRLLAAAAATLRAGFGSHLAPLDSPATIAFPKPTLGTTASIEPSGWQKRAFSHFFHKMLAARYFQAGSVSYRHDLTSVCRNLSPCCHDLISSR